MSTPFFEKYRRMQERFQLPQLSELTSRFKIELEGDEHLFEQIRMEISDRLFSFSEKIVEPIIAGSDAFCCMFEQDMVSEDDRKRLFELYKKLQVLKWENNLLSVKPDDKATMEWISKTWHLWNEELETELTKLCKNLSYKWGTLEFRDEKTNYHG